MKTNFAGPGLETSVISQELEPPLDDIEPFIVLPVQVWRRSCAFRAHVADHPESATRGRCRGEHRHLKDAETRHRLPLLNHNESGAWETRVGRNVNACPRTSRRSGMRSTSALSANRASSLARGAPRQ